jgi:CBS domain-containing protein
MPQTSGIKVIDIMTGEVVIANPGMNVVEVARLMNTFRIGGLPVVENGRLIGMITERDIMTRVVAANLKPSEMRVSQVMTSPPKVIGSIEEDINSIAGKIAKFDVTRIPIVDNENRLMGIVTNRDVLRNSRELIGVLLEQAKVKAQMKEKHTAFGKCDVCGEATHLILKRNRFVCDNCAKSGFAWLKSKL